MATFLAHIKVKPGMEARMEALATAMYAATHGVETHVRRYEYWRGQEERTYVAMESFDDYAGFLEHQASPHHEGLTAGFRDLVESFRIEWIDPIQGASPLVATENQPPPPGATDLMKTYAARMPAEVADWWLPWR